MLRRVVGAVLLAGLALAAAEFAVFVLLVHRWGPLWPVGLSLVTTLAGLWLVRREGGRAWRRVRDAASAGRPPGGEAVAGLVALAGAVLVALPGLVGDVLGLLLWLPPTRRLVAGFAAGRSGALVGLFGPRRVRVRRTRSGPPPGDGAARPRPGGVVEGEVVDP
ncbi:hypothetical protein GCM10010123_43370 [Pilimelia anulata]|uniref:Uncharacterized protein n=1 Tax=Pilimelia anulata TaxID=53371 RepID=A0A8J3BJX6_9ACTN|nr:FxsA family protein [Pilimelia anulata]GGK08829.1 hypothetical protein GCM10010123_43370 [Pilimelia anulata]